ncbi:MAG: septum formation initiator family protein [Desulfobacteraceae bacterium]
MTQRIVLVAVVLGMVFISLLIVYSENGLKDLLALYREEERICETNRQLEAENRKLVRQVKRLKQDMDYIEHLARHELGMAGREELVFKSRKQQNSTKGEP